MGRELSHRKTDQKAFPTKWFLNKAIFLLVLALLIAGAGLGLRRLLLGFPNFTVKKVVVINFKGKPVAKPEDFFRLDQQLNLFNFDMPRLVQDIKARHPELADVLIRKRFPNKLEIIIKEREPQAIIAKADSYAVVKLQRNSHPKLAQKIFLVDAEGFILPFHPAYSDLPQIYGIPFPQIQVYSPCTSLNLKTALQLIKELKRARVYPQYPLERIDVRKLSDIVFYLKNGIEVKVGQNDFRRKCILLKGVLTQQKANNTLAEYIDLRFGSPVAKPQMRH